MLRFFYADQLHHHVHLSQTMFRDRADQFRTRLGWDVTVGDDGEGRDAYDALNPLYVIWENADGSHGGSMRFLPTTGPVMVNDHFGHLISGPIRSPLIWECTRFCLQRGAGPHIAAALMLGGGRVMQGFGIKHFVGVFDARMIRIYRMTGASPEVLGTQGRGRAAVSVGLWDFTEAAQSQLAARAGVSAEDAQLWFDQAFGRAAPPPLAKTA